jgi:tRNA threonylcarbamoyladenosine biosynthesis protein TsaB
MRAGYHAAGSTRSRPWLRGSVAAVLLSLSTSGSIATVALLSSDGDVLEEAASPNRKLHAEKLFALCDEVFERARVERATLRAVACDLGPGSFTGVRVGVAAATGIVLGLGVTAVGVPGLWATARSAGPFSCAAVDAGKGQVFAELREVGAPNEVTSWTLDRSRYAEVAAELSARGCALVGAVHGELGLPFTPGEPDARAVGRAAAAALLGATDAAVVVGQDPGVVFVPLYGRDPDATPLGAQARP